VIKRTITLLAIAGTLTLGHEPVSGEEKAKVLLVCAEPTAMPRTGKADDGSPHGLDVTLARLLCARLGRKLDVHWCASAACSRSCLRDGRCDVILGHPHDPNGAKDIAWSVPYAGAQFGLVVAKNASAPASLTELRGKRVGIVAGTVPLSETEYTLLRYRSRDELLDRFADDKLAAAFLDADFASWYLHRHPKLGLRLVNDYVPREHWNMALAVRAKSVELLTDINKALADLADAGEIRKLYADHGVAYRPPFTNNARRTAALNTWKRIAERGVMVVSVDPANLPYSSAKEDRPGFEVELAQALAREMGVKLRIDWLDVHRATAVGKLLDRDSDLAIGTPIDPNAVEDDDELAGRVIYSRPYYGTGYLLVTRKQGPQFKSLADLKGDSQRLATEAGSIADYRLRQRGYLRLLYRNQLAVLKALNDGAIDAAYLWANVGWALHTSPDFALHIPAGYVPEDHWNIAIAMRAGDDELKTHVDRALDKLIRDGTVARTLARYHMPYFPPFAEQKIQGGAADEVIRHPKADRGQEPQMASVQKSKNPYGGLERVRSAGVLVVGLDQGNLPFSTAHPQPAGLDYDIAGLLAKKLGVDLKIYWGYSSHDSYPSRLATRQLCDVMLGVTPDARFGQRVLYSKPYYLARYALVTRADTEPVSLGQLHQEAVAVEPGVALHGLSRSSMSHEYPSSEAILDAVATAKVKAGYVIATRGAWLAAQRWPGKLQFSAGAVEDRLPICAVVRKADADLKMALDGAFAELARSGELARVFARWHIPYVAPDVKASR
jgi:polar amino acid transport system substrate-binding protein